MLQDRITPSLPHCATLVFAQQQQTEDGCSNILRGIWVGRYTAIVVTNRVVPCLAGENDWQPNQHVIP